MSSLLSAVAFWRDRSHETARSHHSAMSAAWLWLDLLIFGNGHGMAAPYFDQNYYWLDGRLYTFMHGFGAQLHSYQWTHPLPGERRRLCGREFVVFHSRRRGPRVEVAWAMVRMPHGIDEGNAAIRALKSDLDKGSARV